MAKRRAKRTEGVVRLSFHLRKPLEKVIKEATDLNGKVTEKNDLEMLITLLKGVQTVAMGGCTPQTWQRRFTLSSAKKAR